MYKKTIGCLSFFIFAVTACLAQGPWEQKINDKGIEVYTRKPASGKLKELRVVCELACSKTQLIKTLQDIADYHTWVYCTKSTNMLKVVSSQQMIYYSVSHLPWPLKDRDLIVELSIIPGTDTNFEITAKSIPDYIPSNDKCVRVPYSSALWKVNVVNDHLLKIDYTFSVDPGGAIPTWLVNSTLAIGPFNSFALLKEKLKNS
jgi:hypothetical protein